MVLSAAIFKANVQLSDMDRQLYSSYSLTLARHPSETNERMMVRLFAFLCQADEQLVFAKGLSEVNEPDLWKKDLSGQLDLWIEVGLPTVKRIVLGSRQARRIAIFGYGRSAEQWWKKNERDLKKIKNLELMMLSFKLTESLAERVERSMEWQCLIQDNQMSLIDSKGTLELDLAACLRLGNN